MKLIVGAAFALGIVLGGGPTLATNLVADESSSIENEPPTVDPTDETDDPASVSYGQLVTAWLTCTDCGARPHPPGVANGFDAAHAKGHTKKDHTAKSHDANDHADKHGGSPSKGGHGKGACHHG